MDDHHPSTDAPPPENAEDLLSPLEHDLLEEYATLVGNLDDVSIIHSFIHLSLENPSPFPLFSFPFSSRLTDAAGVGTASILARARAE
jgi:hypothetical protein